MIKKNLQLILALFLSTVLFKLQAQEISLSAGGDATGLEGSISFSIGQVSYISINGVTGFINEGVQQPVNFTSLPVTFLNLKASAKENNVILNWQTATELNTKKFVVQRSNNNVTFSPLNEIPASINSSSIKNYASEDIKPFKGINYYRIKQVDVDGRFELSNVVVVNFPKKYLALLYPNPTFKNVTLKVDGLTPNSLSYQLFDLGGKLLINKRITNSETVIEISGFAASTYILKIIENNLELKTFKIVKNKE